VAAEEGAQFYGWEHMLVFEGAKKNVDKDGDYLEN